MIGLESLEKLIATVLWTGWVKHERPVSLLIVAKPESGKTEMMEKFKYNKGVVYMTDVTAYGIVKAIFPLIDSGQPVKHIIIPDFSNPLSKQQATSKAFVSFLNSLIEDGICQIQTYAIQIKKENIRCGLITACTQEYLWVRKKLWRGLGFMTRLLPFSYTYTVDKARRILESIVDRGYYKEGQVKLDLPDKEVEVELPRKFAEELLPYSRRLGTIENVYGFRLQRQLQTLSEAHALMSGRICVEQKDVEEIKKLAEWVNLDFKLI